MKNLTEGNIYKNFLLFAIPIILSALLSQLYSTVDSIIAGKYLGEHGLAAVGATSAFISFITAMFYGYSLGTSVRTAMLFGSGDHKALKTSIYSNTIILIIAAVTVSLLSVIFKNFIFDMLNVDTTIRKDTTVYFVIYISGLVLFILNSFYVTTLHAVGITGFAMNMSILSMVINVSGNMLSVVVLKIGVLGIALSSVVSALMVCVCYYRKLQKCYKELGCLDYKAKISLKIVKKNFSYALPVMFQQGIITGVSLIISPIVNGIGTSATAAYSIVGRFYSITLGVYQNSSKALMNYTAQSVGAKNIGNLKKGVKVGFLQGFIFTAPVLIACMIFAEPVCRVFFPKGYEGDALNYSVVFVRYFVPFIAFNVINNLFHSFFRGINAMNLLVVSTAVFCVARIVSSLILTKPYGMNGVYWGWSIGWICESVFVTALYFSGVWKKKLTNTI